MKANNFTSAGHNRINSIFYQIFHRNSYDRFTILLLTFFIFYGIIRLLRGGSPSPVQLSTVIRSRLIQALWLCLVALIELLCWTHWSIRVKILRLLPRSLFFFAPPISLLHFFTHVITNILPAASYLQAFCFCIFPKMPLAPSGYPLKPRKRGPLGGASQASLNCRFPAGASAKRRGRWPLARANPPCLVFIKVHLQGIRRNPASGAPSAERRRQSLLARTLRVRAFKAHQTKAPRLCLGALVWCTNAIHIRIVARGCHCSKL